MKLLKTRSVDYLNCHDFWKQKLPLLITDIFPLFLFDALSTPNRGSIMFKGGQISLWQLIV